MFEDGKLAKALAAEEKTGLVIQFNGEQITIIGRDWLALIPQCRLRECYRQTLGHLVEVLGYVPEVETLEIWKTKGEYSVDHPMPEVVGEQAGAYVGGEVATAKYTGLRKFGDALYQTRGGAVYGCAQRGPWLKDSPEAVLTVAGTLLWTDDNTGEELYRRAERPRVDNATDKLLREWDHLEAFAWCEWEEPPAPAEIDGQEAMEDGND